MKHIDLEELRKQTEYWKTKLNQIENENIQFKTRLMKILSTAIPRSKLEALDYFHTRFIQLDEHIILLKHEVTEQRERIVNCDAQAATDMTNFLLLHQQLEEKLVILHRRFGGLQREFDMYLRQWC